MKTNSNLITLLEKPRKNLSRFFVFLFEDCVCFRLNPQPKPKILSPSLTWGHLRLFLNFDVLKDWIRENVKGAFFEKLKLFHLHFLFPNNYKMQIRGGAPGHWIINNYSLFQIKYGEV